MTDEKVACSQCGTRVLPATAQRNGGVCAPCLRGVRSEIEAGKAWHRARREHDASDSARILWCSLIERVDGDEGYEALTDAERLFFAVTLLEMEIYNGGFEQYFFNTSGDLHADAVRGLQQMGATAALGLPVEARRCIFGEGRIPAETAGRREAMRTLTTGQSERLVQLDRVFCSDPDRLDALVGAFLRQNGLG